MCKNKINCVWEASHQHKRIDRRWGLGTDGWSCGTVCAKHHADGGLWHINCIALNQLILGDSQTNDSWVMNDCLDGEEE